MNQNDPNNSGLGTGTTGNIGSGGTSTGSGYGTGGTGTGMGSGGGMTTGSGGGSTGGFGVSSGSDFSGGSSAGSMSGGGLGSGTGDTASSTCPHCGQSIGGGGLEQFLGRLGITEDMLGNLKSQFNNVDIDEYLNTARDYLKNSGGKATTYAKENPGKVAAGVAALALGAGLLYASVNRDKT